RTAAAREDDHIEIADLRETVERGDERLYRADPLHLRRREDALHARISPRDDLLDVVPHGADRARDHADASRGGRQWPLALDREESLRGEAPLQRLETQVRIAGAGRTEVVHLQLAAPVLRVELDVPVREDLVPIAR